MLIGTPLHVRGENYCPDHYWSGSATTRVYLLEDVATVEVDLVIGVNFISCVGSAMIAFVLYSPE